VCENDFKIGAELCKCKDNQKAMGVDDNGGKQSKRAKRAKGAFGKVKF